MLRFIPPISATANITFNNESDPDQRLVHTLRHNKTHKDKHTVKDTQSNSTSVLVQMSYLCAVTTVCFCFLFWRKGAG